MPAAYLFGGQGASTQPFADAPGGVAYRGISGERRTEEGTDLPLTVNGDGVFMTARTGNGVFETRAGAGVTAAWIDNGQVSDPAALDRLDLHAAVQRDGRRHHLRGVARRQPHRRDRGALHLGQDITVDGMTFRVSGTPAAGDSFTVAPSSLDAVDLRHARPGGRAARHRRAQHGADRAGQHRRRCATSTSPWRSCRARAVAGEMLVRIEGETSRLADQSWAAQEQRASAEDLDMTEAISKFQSRQNRLRCRAEVVPMVQRLSLFDYLNA